jgi:hypothetical protein
MRAITKLVDQSPSLLLEPLKIMELDSLISSTLNDIEKILPAWSIKIIRELLRYEEPELAVEFMCDKLIEYKCIIPERLGKMLQVLSYKLHLEPEISWWGIVVEDPETKQPVRLLAEKPDLTPPGSEIFEKVKQDLLPSDASLIDEFMTAGEDDLAIDELCLCLINDHIPISKSDADVLRTIWLDMGRDPNDLANFTIEDKKSS